MNTLLLILSICAFILGILGFITDLTGHFFLKFFYKTICLFAATLSVIYWCKLLHWI